MSNLCCVPLQARFTFLWGTVGLILIEGSGWKLMACAVSRIVGIAGLICKGMKIELHDPASSLLSKALVQLLLACSLLALFERMSNNRSLACSGQRALSVTAPE